MAEDTPDKKFAFKYLFSVQARAIEGGFSKVSGISEEIEVVDQRDGSDPFQVRKIKGMHQGGSVTLERGVVGSRNNLLQWFMDVKKGMPYTANVWVRLMDPDAGNRENSIFSVRMKYGWPSKWELGDLDAKSSDLAVETITIVHEGIEYMGPKAVQKTDSEAGTQRRTLKPYKPKK